MARPASCLVWNRRFEEIVEGREPLRALFASVQGVACKVSVSILLPSRAVKGSPRSNACACRMSERVTSEQSVPACGADLTALTGV